MLEEVAVILIDDHIKSHQTVEDWVSKNSSPTGNLYLRWADWERVGQENWSQLYERAANNRLPAAIIFVDLDFNLEPETIAQLRERIRDVAPNADDYSDQHIGGLAFISALARNPHINAKTLVVIATDKGTRGVKEEAHRLAPNLEIVRCDGFRSGNTADSDIESAVQKYAECFGDPVTKFYAKANHDCIQDFGDELRSALEQLLCLGDSEMASVITALSKDGDPQGKRGFAKEAIKCLSPNRPQLSAIGGWLLALAAFQRCTDPFGRYQAKTWSNVFDVSHLENCRRLDRCFLSPIPAPDSDPSEIARMFYHMCLELFTLGLSKVSLSPSGLEFKLENQMDQRFGHKNAEALRRRLRSHQDDTLRQSQSTKHRMALSVWRFWVATSLHWGDGIDQGVFGGSSFWRMNVLTLPDHIEVVFRG
jgi:hypothetical protein